MITHKNAGVVRHKELPQHHNSQDRDGDTPMDGPNEALVQPFHPFNSDLDVRGHSVPPSANFRFTPASLLY